MPRIIPQHVVTFSSEDPNHPASNLLLGDTYRKWKCKSEGESEVSVVLQLEKATSISSVDIGNDFSAFVEVLVARSGTQSAHYEVLLPSSAFMSAIESRSGTSPNRVRMFAADKLNKTVGAQKWDLVKIVCSQPFNKHVKYGLAFINIHRPGDLTEPPKIGGFGILVPTVENDPIKVGSFFNRKKDMSETKSTPSTTAATIREATASLIASHDTDTGKMNSILGKRKLEDTNEEIVASPGLIKSQPVNLKAQSASSVKIPGTGRTKSGRPNGTGNSSTPTRLIASSKQTNSSNGSLKIKSNSNTSAKPATLSNSSHKRTSVPSPSTKIKNKPKIRKPFNNLFDDVVFTISGYENPYRSVMRKKAIEMGAVCKPDWDSSCTHLICAFVNTPKFRYVRSCSRGKIIKMKWIEDSYAQRKRLPWRKYWVDRNDNMSESEEEILAMSDNEESSSEPKNNSIIESNGNNESMKSETEPSGSNEDHKNESGESELSSEGEAVVKKCSPRFSTLVPSSSEDEADEYDDDTDVDNAEDGKELGSVETKSPCSQGDDFFRYIYFFLDSELKKDTQIEVEKIIFNHRGTIQKVFDEAVEYFITEAVEWKEKFSDDLSDNPSLTFVRVEWITKCDEENKMISPIEFMLLPV